MSTPMIRGRVRGGRIEPTEDVTLPEGANVSIMIDEPEVGTAQALAAAARRAPHLEPGDIEALEQAIEAGKLPVPTDGVFDEAKG